MIAGRSRQQVGKVLRCAGIMGAGSRGRVNVERKKVARGRTLHLPHHQPPYHYLNCYSGLGDGFKKALLLKEELL